MKNKFLFALTLVAAMIVANASLATLGLSAATRTAMATAIRDGIDAGNQAGRLQICSNARPATCASSCTVLASLPLADPSGTVTTGVLNFSSITSQSASGTGTALWYRVDSMNSGSPTCVYDGSVGAGSGDLSLNTTSIVSGATVSVTSASITMPNS